MGEDVLKGILGATAGKESGDPKDVLKHRDESRAMEPQFTMEVALVPLSPFLPHLIDFCLS